MKLTAEQLRTVTHGAATVTEEADGVHFFRFSEEQQEFYRLRSEASFVRALATAGVTVEFMTDSRTLTVEARFDKASSRPFAFIDVVCDGVTVAHIGSDTAIDGLFGKALNLGDGTHRVKLVLPWSAAAVLRRVEIENGATVTPVTYGRRLLLFGDSITQGYDARYPSYSYASLLTERLGAEARNKAIGGEVFCADLLDAAEAFEPDTVTVAYGTNDWSRCGSAAEWEAHARDFLARLSAKYPATDCFAVAPLWRADCHTEKPAGPFAALEPTLRRITADLPNVTVVSGDTLMPHDTVLFADGGLHPNDAGFAFYAERLYEVIRSRE